ncbi:MAG TPA: ATP-binding cassette domain-containing protein, partial [Terriglobales bacterium]|nr:ATP-binding cassette domain-containing protein [Terriglobales bacterium]
SITDSPSCILFPDHDWSLTFTGVEFAYEQQETPLRIRSLHISRGEELAIIGENGAGKSTLAKLIARVYDVKAGAIHVGGTDIRDIQLRSLRRNACYLPRDPVLFDGTLESNLRFVKPNVSDRELQEVIHQTELAIAVAALPDGIHQRIGPDGCQLSGGERQRLAIARALLQRPRILILDEATACLDAASEANTLRNLRTYLPTTTVIVVSHRGSTLSRFARILAVSRGRIVEDSASNASTCDLGSWPRISSAARSGVPTGTNSDPI